MRILERLVMVLGYAADVLLFWACVGIIIALFSLLG